MMMNLKNPKLRSFLESGGIPAKYLKQTDPKGYPVEIDKLAKISEKSGLLIYGGVGTGKTQLAADLVEYLAENKQSEEVVGQTVDYVEGKAIMGEKKEKMYDRHLFQFFNVPRLLIKIRGMYDDKEENVDSFIESLDNYEYLVLDDLGAEKPTEWVLETMYVIINQRYEGEKKIIVTSNKTIEELGAVLGDRISSRLLEMCRVIKIGAEDKRAKL